jgi:HSP20 family molecular chaperone IbpA
MATLLQTAQGFARRALAGVGGNRLRIRAMRSPGPRPGVPFSRPAVAVTDRPRRLIVQFEVPGATSRNTLLCWDEDAQTLAVRVDLAPSSEDLPNAPSGGAGERDWYAEVVLPGDVNPLQGSCTLEEGTLRVEAPHNDTPAATVLPLPVTWKPISTPAVACVA